jgi:hypothetical protein
MASNQVTAPPKLLPGLLGGLFIGVLSALPLVSLANCCCLWVVAGGFIAAWLQQQNHEAPITAVDGALVGLLAGFFGGIAHYLVALPIELYLGTLTAGVSDGFMRGARQDMPPELRRLMNELGPHGMLFIGSLFFAGISLMFGMLGGIIGAVMVKKPSPPPPPAPPMPPVTWGAPPPSLPVVGSPRPSWPPPPSPPPPDDKPPEE